tara:strand:+ start:39 stop:764 length:726 start_codon:yes stop_codon:yes gene_type:complete
MPVGNLVVQRAYLRRAVGHAEDTALINDSLLDDCLEEALRMVNLTWFVRGVGSFDTVVDQQVYNPLPADKYKVLKVYWSSDTEPCLPIELNGLIERYLLTENVNEFGVRRAYSPSLLLGFERQREYERKLYGRSAIVWDTNTVYLDPIPSSVKKVYFTFSEARFDTIEDVTDEYANAYFCWAKKTLHEALASGRGALESVNSSAGVSMRTGARHSHLEMAKREEKKWKGLLPPLRPARSMP